jgi:hypothetical protein
MEMGAPTLQHGVCGRGAMQWGQARAPQHMEGEWGLCPAALVMNMLLTGQGVGGGGCESRKPMRYRRHGVGVAAGRSARRSRRARFTASNSQVVY